MTMTSDRVLKIFEEITTIPRESGHEGPMTEYLCKWAEDHGLEYKRDKTGNVCIIRPASPGREDVPAIVLQAHQDMVCEKRTGVRHDFSKDPVRYEIKDGWMVAPDTTLGADDGIGVAACLALMESDADMGRVESVFTISEETGMDGAFAMESGFFSGKVLINLDSEDEGQLFIGCAGGENTDIFFNYVGETPNGDWKRLRLSLLGGQGGHSGDDIGKHRINAVQAMARFLDEEARNGLQLFMLTGGGKSNAIARDCEALVAVPNSTATRARFQAFAGKVKEEYSETETGLVFKVKGDNNNEKAIDSKVALSLLHALATCPHGVEKMSPDIEGLVQTSTNLAAVDMKRQGVIKLLTSQRSSVVAELDGIVKKVAKHFEAAGAEVESYGRYPGWTPDLNSHILDVCVESYKRLFGRDPLVLAIHAGLECGLFLEKFPGLDMISFGPTLRGVHSPGERLELASVDKFVRLLDDVVCNYR